MDFLFHNLDARYDELRDLSSGDGGRGGLNLTLIRSLKVALPKKLEQEAIAQALNDLAIELDALTKRVAKARQLRQGMAQELLSGRVRLV